MRYLRLFLGSLVIAGALYIIVGEHVRGASSNAFVNASLITVRAPLAGIVSIPSRPVGAEVAADRILFSLNDPRADRVHLDDLELELSRMLSEIDRLSAVKAAALERRDRLEAQYAAYAGERQNELDMLAGVAGPAGPLSAEVDDEIVSRSAVSPATEPLLATSDSLIELQIAAAGRGIFLDESAGAAWNLANWRDSADLELARADADLGAAQAALAAIEERIAEEQARLITLSSADIAAPNAGILWQQIAANGTVVERGDPVLKLADCATAVVSLSVSESVYNRLRTGDPATFRFAGSKRVIAGTIARLAGTGAASVYDDMAVKPSRAHLDRYDVTIYVPELRSADISGGCNIGRTGRVFFENRPLDPLRRWLN